MLPSLPLFHVFVSFHEGGEFLKKVSQPHGPADAQKNIAHGPQPTTLSKHPKV